MSDDEPRSDSTCWVLVRGAAAGAPADRSEFARRYEGVVRAYLGHRWRASRLREELDDAVQDVFVECFRQGGVLDRMHERPSESFRAFLFGVTRNVALRHERRIGRRREKEPGKAIDDDSVESDEATLSTVFDRAWAQSMFRQAGALQEERARAVGGAALRRVELLRLRSVEDLPIRDIAKVWGEDPARVHKEYARARNEFRAALQEVVAFHQPRATAAEVEAVCVNLVDLLRGP